MKPKKTILCVDDNEAELSIRKIMLQTRGYHVLVCRTAAQAIALFHSAAPDLVLATLGLPAADDAWLIQQIKTISPRTPTIALTERGSAGQYNTCADVVLTQGMHTTAHLLEHIRVLLIKRRSGTTATTTGKLPARSLPQPTSRIGAA